MKVYVVQTLQLLEEDKDEITDINSISSILGVYTDFKKALIQSIWYNLTDFEYTEDSLRIDKLSNDVKTFIRAYLDEDEVDHELRFVMKNKTQEHTTVDEQGSIVKDARLTISNVTFDEILLEQIFFEQAVYTHDFNGTQAEITDKFYGEMGCNGTVSLKFFSPVYLWLLETM